MTNDLTTGNPLTLIIKFAIPLLLGNIFLQIYQISDMVIVGRLLGTEALAAVGSSAKTAAPDDATIASASNPLSSFLIFLLMFIPP